MSPVHAFDAPQSQLRTKLARNVQTTPYNRILTAFCTESANLFTRTLSSGNFFENSRLLLAELVASNIRSNVLKHQFASCVNHGTPLSWMLLPLQGFDGSQQINNRA